MSIIIIFYNLYFLFATGRLNYIHSFSIQVQRYNVTYIYYTISYWGTIYIQVFHIPAHGYVLITISRPWGLSQPGSRFVHMVLYWGSRANFVLTCNLSNCACLRHLEAIPGHSVGVLHLDHSPTHPPLYWRLTSCVQADSKYQSIIGFVQFIIHVHIFFCMSAVFHMEWVHSYSSEIFWLCKTQWTSCNSIFSIRYRYVWWHVHFWDLLWK